MAKRLKRRGLAGSDHALKVSEKQLDLELMRVRADARNGKCRSAMFRMLDAARIEGKNDILNTGSEGIRHADMITKDDFEGYCIISTKLGAAPKRKTSRKSRRK